MFTPNKLQLPVTRGAAFAVAAALLTSAASTRAALLVDPSAGTVTASSAIGVGPTDKDDGAYQAMYGPFGSFFGSAIPGINPTISLNGHLYWGSGDGNGDYFLQPLGTNGMTRIAPMWHDFKLGSSGRVIEEVGAAWYAVTWENMESNVTAGTYATFQAVFFEFATTLHGVNFNPGDIAFSYGDTGAYQAGNEMMVGMEAGTSFAALPGTEPQFGWNRYADTGDLAVGDGEFALFRPNGSGSYNVSVLPIPEPGSAALGLIGGALLFRRRRAC